jgi:hypothetical protein
MLTRVKTAFRSLINQDVNDSILNKSVYSAYDLVLLLSLSIYQNGLKYVCLCNGDEQNITKLLNVIFNKHYLHNQVHFYLETCF